MRMYRFTIHDSRTGTHIGIIELPMEDDAEATAEGRDLRTCVGVMVDEIRHPDPRVEAGQWKVAEEVREVATF